ANPARAQNTLQSANGQTSIVELDNSFVLSFDAKDSGLGVTYNSSRFGWNNNLVNNFSLLVAAQKGKRDLFSSGDFTPGLEVGDRIAWGHIDSHGGYKALFLSGAFQIARQKTADLEDDVVVADDVTASTFTLGGGVNWMPGP